MTSRVEEYLIPRRLEEVLALIQVLGLDEEYTRRSEKSLERDLQGKPRSAENWKELAKQHPEFFRVNEKHEFPISLVARDVSARNADGRRLPLSVDFVQELLKTAREMHSIQLKRQERWTVYLPVWGAFVTGFFGLIATAVKLWLDASHH
jgi:hypothetical protein